MLLQEDTFSSCCHSLIETSHEMTQHPGLWNSKHKATFWLLISFAMYMDIRIGKDCPIVHEHNGILIHKSVSESEIVGKKRNLL